MISSEPNDNTSIVLGRLLVKQPFFASLVFNLCKLQFVSGEDADIPTAATTGDVIYLNEDFLAEVGTDASLFVVAHEVGHIILEHVNDGADYMKMGVGPYGLPWNQKIANIATDLVLNALLVDCGFTMPVDKNGANIGLLDTNKYPSDRMWVDVYKELYDQAEKQGQGQGKDQGQGQGQGKDQGQGKGSKQGHASHDKWGEGKEPSTAKVQRALKNAELTAAAAGMGNLPGNLQRIIDKWCTPQVDWREQVESTIEANNGTGASTWSRPRRKSLVLPPNVYLPAVTGHRAGTVVVYGDTSGSIDDTTWTYFFGEMRGICEQLNPAELYIGSCDYEAYDPVPIEHADELADYKPVGGGGTRMPAIYERLEQEGIVPDVLVILTDGYTPFDSAPPYPVVWVMTTDVVAPYGKSVRIQLS